MTNLITSPNPSLQNEHNSERAEAAASDVTAPSTCRLYTNLWCHSNTTRYRRNKHYHREPKFWTHGSVYCVCTQRPARVSLRLARLPRTASSAQRSRRLRSTHAAARVLLAHAEVTKNIILFQWVQTLGTLRYNETNIVAALSYAYLVNGNSWDRSCCNCDIRCAGKRTSTSNISTQLRNPAHSSLKDASSLQA